MKNHRRNFIKHGSVLASGILLVPELSACTSLKGADGQPGSAALDNMKKMEDPWFHISLAQWSLNKQFFGGKLDNLDFADKAKSFDIHAIEYVNQFFKDKAEDSAYLAQMNTRADNAGVKQLLIMIDREGNLGDLDDAKRKVAIENHYKWVDAAKTLGCHSIRVNAYGEGTAEEVADAAVQGLGGVSEYGAKVGINVIVENHGSYSSNGAWLAGVMKQVNMGNCGTLPDFGNFCIKREGWTNCLEEYDRYKGVDEMMPYAKAVSAKTHDFDDAGNETHTDYLRMMKIVKDHGFRGYVGIEYEGRTIDDETGILKTRDLLRKVREQLA